MKSIPASEVASWVQQELLAPRRRRPIVAVTPHGRSGVFLVPPYELEQRVGEWADVVSFGSEEATRELARQLPKKLEVYGGAMRVWWPGLAQDPDWRHHRLFQIESEQEGTRAVKALEEELRRWTRELAEPASPREPVVQRGGQGPEVESELVTLSVLSLDGEILLQDADGELGQLVDADLPLRALALCLEEGMDLRVRRPRDHDGRRGPAPCSVEGLLRSPWDGIAETLQVGDTVRGRVSRLEEAGNYALVELLPGAAGFVHKSEIDHTFVERVADLLHLGELVDVKILELSPAEQRATLSVKEAVTESAPLEPSPSLVTGGLAFDWERYIEREGVSAAVRIDEREEQIEGLERELAAITAERVELRQVVIGLRAELRSLKARHELLEREASGEEDPLASKRAFLRSVRLWYAREVGESERPDHPLRRMRVGQQFLESARALEGASREKIVEVAAQVACGRAKDLSGREVHPLKGGGPTARQRSRSRDDAKAWRCALQIHTPSARRLHWWAIPGPEGETIEFACVGVHDCFDIPE